MIQRLFHTLLHGVGLAVRETKVVTQDMDKKFLRLYTQTRPYTMTSVERMYSLYKATEYISQARIGGDIVECGVWRGGSAMICAYELMRQRDTKRKIYLYDTYEGMTRPTKVDKAIMGQSGALPIWQKHQKGQKNEWCYADLEDVKRNMAKTKYPLGHIKFIKGRVEDTIPKETPQKIALLRLDTDWYASTKHELIHLYPRLVPGGVLIIDDYGHWAGSKKAVDEYFQKHKTPMLLQRIDYSGRIGTKPY
jgi:O-methyltransferase